ncbi:MAG: response regulator [Labilibaculum sp.]|nr:response regulator [Labilibaculum sp.]MBI9058897.1 response regulator [Labilibaculum sp.]
MNDLIKIVHLEDLPSDAGLAEREISKVLKNYDIKVVENKADFILALEEYNPDIFICDYKLPSFDGMSALKIVLERSPHIPVILLTGSMNEDTAVNCLKTGAADYVIKEHIKRLGPAVLNALEQKKIKKEKNIALQQIKLLSKSIEKSPVSVIITDPFGNLEYVNPKFIELTGYSTDEVYGKNMRIFNSGKQPREFYEQMWKTILKGDDWKGEMLNKGKNAELYWESVAISSIVDENDEILHFIGIKEDITEKKRILEELIEAKEKAEESDRLKSAFLANMSHEIRTPMNGILGFSGLLKEPKLTGEKQQRYIGIIEKSGARMLNIINNIVDISKIESGTMEIDLKETNINDQLDYVFIFFKPEVESKRIDLVLKNTLSVKEAIINTDSEKIYAILINLVKNAIKYTDKGSIEFGCDFIEKHNSSFLQFFVKDSGVGIAEDRQEDIFERFIQADINDVQARQGAGLGLSISKAYIKMLGGKIWVESNKGIGSTFYFTLPYHPASNEKEIVKTEILLSNEENSIKKLIILIVEDDEPSEMLISLEIEEFAKKIVRASNGLEAVEACLNNPDVDLILMDVKMPEMNGYVATQQIRKFNKDVVIIAQTAFGLSGDRQKALDAGCNDYISKPYNKKDFNATIRKYFKN